MTEKWVVFLKKWAGLVDKDHNYLQLLYVRFYRQTNTSRVRFIWRNYVKSASFVFLNKRCINWSHKTAKLSSFDHLRNINSLRDSCKTKLYIYIADCIHLHSRTTNVQTQSNSFSSFLLELWMRGHLSSLLKLQHEKANRNLCEVSTTAQVCNFVRIGAFLRLSCFICTNVNSF